METFMWNGELDWEEIIKTVVLLVLVVGVPLGYFIKGFVNGYLGKNVK